jgi:hypothetical protein
VLPCPQPRLKSVGAVPAARMSAYAVAAIAGATPSSPAPPAMPVVGGITITWVSNGVFHSRV